MYPLSADAVFCQTLRNLDYELFQSAKAKGCPHCGSRLDTANYWRKTRGMAGENELCFSLCCRKEGCRKRRSPKSLRFLGRKVYGAWVVILAVDFCYELGLTGSIARQTISRWKNFWKHQLAPASPFLMFAQGRLKPGAVLTDRPASLVAHFAFPSRESWIPILKFFTTAV